MQYKNYNTAFHRNSAVPGGLASLRAFCQWNIEHQVRKCCVKGLILRNVAGTSCSAASPKLRMQMFQLARNSSLFGTLPVKAQNDKTCQKFLGSMVPLTPSGYACGYKKIMKKKEQYLSTSKSSQQDCQALQNSDEKQYCQYWMLFVAATI